MGTDKENQNQGAKQSTRRGLHFEALEPRILFDASAGSAPTAEVTVSTGELTANEDQFINDNIEFNITFDNNGGQEGYVPYVDFLAEPEMEIEGVSAFGGPLNNPEGAGTDPIGMVSLTGQLVDIANGNPIDHPQYSSSIGSPSSDFFGGAGSGSDPVTFNPSFAGYYVYSVQLPFGSFTPGNPPADIVVEASLDDADDIEANRSYELHARGGFSLGCDPLDNPGLVDPGDDATTDAPIFGAFDSSSVYPIVMDLVKSASVAEDEGAYTGENVSGPNHPVTYRLEIDIADGETINNLNLTDVLPDDLAYLGNLTVTNGSGGAIGFVNNNEPSLSSDDINGVTAADNTLNLTFPSVTGGSGVDVIVTYEAFIPYVEEGGALVVDEDSGEEGDLDEYNDARITGDWTNDAGSTSSVSDNAGPANGGDPDGVLGERETDYRIEEHSLAIQKGVGFVAESSAGANDGGDRAASGWSEGDIAEFSMNFQVSDYFAFGSLLVTDVMGDGLEFLPDLDPVSSWANAGDFDTDPLGNRPVLTFEMYDDGNGSGGTLNVAFDEANFSAVENNADGTTRIIFNVYQQLVDSGFIVDGEPVLGGMIPTTGLGTDPMGSFDSGVGTRGSITYNAKVRNEYVNALGDTDVNQGDTLVNNVTIQGDNLDVTDLTSNGNTVTDGSGTTIEIVTGAVSKELFSTSRNGVQRLATDLDGGLEVVPGDVITWKITYELPITEFEGLTISDYLPLPVFDVTEIDTSGVYAYSPTGYLTGGRISFGEGDTFIGDEGVGVANDGGIDEITGYATPAVPTISLDPDNNAFTINFGDYDIPEAEDPLARTIELFVSTTITDAVYAEGLQFTNQVSTTESNSFNSTVASNEIGQIVLGVPDLSITKGVLAVDSTSIVTYTGSGGPLGVDFNAPGSAEAFDTTSGDSIISDSLDDDPDTGAVGDEAPIDRDIQDADAGDVVTFGITVQNRGSADYGAFDVRISDSLPAGFEVPTTLAGLNLRVTDGNGTTIDYDVLDNMDNVIGSSVGGTLTPAATFTESDVVNAFFAGSIELVDPDDNTGALAEYDGTSGENLVLVAYDLVIEDAAGLGSELVNTATVENFSYRNGGPNYAEPEDTDTASVTIERPTVIKEVVETSHVTTSNEEIDPTPAPGDPTGRADDNLSEVAIGEVVTYTVTIDIPEGTLENVTIQDNIQPGMAFVGVDSISFDPGLSTSKGATDFSDVDVYYDSDLSRIRLGVGGTAGLGTIVNSDTDNTVPEQVTFTYKAVVLNDAVNQAGVIRSNDAEIRWQNGGSNLVEDDSVDVRVVEPNISVNKSLRNTPATVEGADTVTYRIVVRNNDSSGNTSEGYDVELSDFLPDDVTFISATYVNAANGLAPDVGIAYNAGSGSNGELTASWNTFDVGSIARFDVVVQVNDALLTDTVITNTANVEFTSLPGELGDAGHDGYDPAADSGSFSPPPVPGPTDPDPLEDAFERTGDPGDPGGTANDYNRQNSATVTVINPVGIDKVVIETSEDHTAEETTAAGDVEVAIGEVVRYEVRIRVPQANSSDLELVDVLGAGLEWIPAASNDIQFRLEGFNPDGSTISASAFTAPELTAALAGSTDFPAGNVSFNGASNTVTFDFGDIINTETDSAEEFIYISYNAIVQNKDPNDLVDPGVTRGATLTNTVQLREGGVNIGAPLTQEVTVVEPDLTISKSDDNTTTADAGDVIDYTLTITAGTSTPQLHSTAFDLLISDALPDQLNLVASSVQFVGLPGTSVGNIIENTVTDSFTATVDRLEPGETFQITFQGTVRDTGANIIEADETVTNTASLVYSTLPGDGTDVTTNGGTVGNETGNEAGTPGDTDGERITTRTDFDSFTSPAPVLSKVLANPADTTFTIGESVEYVITLQVPEGEVGDPEAYIIDSIDPGFRFIPGTLAVTPSAGISVDVTGVLDETNANFFTFTDPGNTAQAEELRFDFDRILFNESAAADGLANGTIEIRYQLQVENILANQQGDTLNNEADFFYTDEDGTTRRTVQDSTGDSDTIITIVEPQVNTVKTTTNVPATPEAGEVISYRVTLTNPGGPTNLLQDVTAFDVTAQDVIPTNLDLSTGTFTAVSSISGDVSGSFTVTANGWSLLASEGLDLAAGEVITITYDAVIQEEVRNGEALTNEVDAEWTSIDGTALGNGVNGERTGDGNLNDNPSPGGLNNYESDDEVTVFANFPNSITKRVLSTSSTATDDDAGTDASIDDLVIGETVTYEIVATLGRGTNEGVRIIDQLSTANGLLDITSIDIFPGTDLSLPSGDINVVGSFLSDSLTSGDVAGSDGYRDRFVSSFGTVINSATGSRTSEETIRFVVTATLVNDPENQQGDVIENTATLEYLDDPDQDGSFTTESLSGSVNIEVIEPQVDVNKTTVPATPTSTQAGDTIDYRVTLSHPGGPANQQQNVTAFDVTAQDVLPTNLTLNTGSFTAILNPGAGQVDVSGLFNVTSTGWTLTGNLDLDPGDVVQIDYDATIGVAVRDGDDLVNEVDIEWTSLDGTNAGERGGNGDLSTETPGGGANDYEEGDNASIRANLTPEYSFEKSVFTTSETFTGDNAGTSLTIPDLVIGETVTFDLVATIGRGTTDQVRIVDQLSIANGLLDITNVQVQAGAALSLGSGNPFTSLTISETDNLGTDGYNDRVEINFGTVINDPDLVTDAASEQIRIRIEAVLVNDFANQDGDVIRNTGTMTFLDDVNGDGTRTTRTMTSDADVEIVEPVVNTTKTITTLPANPTAGERVEYQVVLSNPAAVAGENIIAFDVTARDDLPNNLSMDVSTFEARLNGTLVPNTNFTLTTDGWALVTPSGLDLDQGDNLVITYEAVIQPGVQDGENLVNEVDVEWTSLDGTVAGERTGNGDLDSETPGGQPNDYESGDTADFDAEFTSAFAFDKSIVSTSENTGEAGGTDAGMTDLVIGETVTYALTATLGRGTTDGVRIIDQLAIDNGILDITNVQINPGSALSLQSGAPFSSITPAITDSLLSDSYRDRIEINFGTVVNDASATVIADEQIQILVTARVVNIADNTAGDVITNSADFFYFDDPGGTGTQSEQTIRDTENVEILEPNLSITKRVNNDQPRLNEVLTYTLTVTNNSGTSATDAFDLVIDDLMDPRMTLDTGSVRLIIPGSPLNPSSIVSDTSTANNLVLNIDRLDEGESIEITYEVRVSSDIADFNAVLPNDVELYYSSTEGSNPNERGGDPDTNDPNDPDTYTDDDDESVEVFQPDLRIEKVDYDAEIVPGGLITYEMTVTNQGRAEALGVNVTDDISHYLDAGFTFLTGTNATLTDGVVTFVLPNMPVNDIQVITMTLQAPDVIPAGLESITNIAVANHDDIDPTPPDNEDPEDTPVIATPDLVVTKDDGLLLALTGDEITYVITFTNVGDQVASGVVIEDVLPPEMGFISASNGGILRGDSVFWGFNELAPGEVRTVEVTAVVIRPGLKINTVTIKDDGRGGPDPTPDNNKDIDETDTEWRFRYDLTQDFRTSNGNLALSDYRFGDNGRILRREPVILATYMASGLAQAGSTITLEVFDERGQLIADTSVVADAGGNWLASFPMADVEKQPARIEMKQTWASYNPAGERSYNFRTYFGPAFSTGTYYTEDLTVHSVMEKRNPTEVIDLYESAKMILAMDWNGQLYEFAARGALQSSSGN